MEIDENVQVPVTNEWPEGKKVLFVDGNNMLYLTAGLRNMTLRGNKSKTERVLVSIAEAFSLISGFETNVMFDNTRHVSKKTLDSGLDFTVSSAAPQFNTSDDAMADWAESSGLAAVAIFITSDRGLTERLRVVGGTVIKPGQFMRHACQLLSGVEGDYKSWVDTWISTME
jgi:predicted RNA-binding protein with PIN domain